MTQINSQLCRAPSSYKHLGSEGDWLNFFWGLWTQGGSNRFDIGEIEDVWANTPGEKNGVYCVPKTTQGKITPSDWRLVSNRMGR